MRRPYTLYEVNKLISKKWQKNKTTKAKVQNEIILSDII